MASAKRVILTNETPNDQGGIIINKSIDWKRFNSNPVMLYQHGDDFELGETPIGHWEDLQFSGGNWSAVPVFSGIDHYKVKQVRQLFEEGNLKAASIGGACLWKKTGRTIHNEHGESMPEVFKNNQGLKESEKFIIYEASIVILPSNPEAVALSAKCYNEEEIVVLSSKLNKKVMEETKQAAEEIQIEAVSDVEETNLEAKETKKEKEPKEVKEVKETKEPVKPVQHVILSSDEDREGLISQGKKFFIGLAKDIFSSLQSEMKVPLHDEPGGGDPIAVVELPQEDLPAGQTVEVQTEIVDVKECRNEAELMADVEACNNATELESLEAKSDLPQVVKDAIALKKETLKTNLSSSFMETPELKKPEEMEVEKMAAKPAEMTVTHRSQVPDFTTLRGDKEGRKHIEQVLTCGGKNPSLESHRIVLQSILNDKRLSAVCEKFTISDKSGNRSIPMAKLTDVMGRLDSGAIETMNFRSGKLENYTELAASADLLATPDLIGVEWLSLFVYSLFPSASWKSEIPVYGASSPAGNNLGFIWANIAANPAIYQGSRPVTPTAYEYSDSAVSLTLSPFYLQPMLWQPAVMQQLRYDQMGSGWAQALKVLNTAVDDYLIYTFASLIPAASMVKTASDKAFDCDSANAINKFILNPSFAGSLAKPTLDDLLIIEQLIKKQNFPEGTKIVVVLDPTGDRYITADPETKSLLTRFVNSEGDELISYKNTKLRTRSKVAVVNPAASYAVLNPASVIPATAISANLAFVPEQVAIGLANLDVFMYQNPEKYGYEMSADIRVGGALLRANGAGTCLYTYGEPTV